MKRPDRSLKRVHVRTSSVLYPLKNQTRFLDCLKELQFHLSHHFSVEQVDDPFGIARIML